MKETIISISEYEIFSENEEIEVINTPLWISKIDDEAIRKLSDWAINKVKILRNERPNPAFILVDLKSDLSLMVADKICEFYDEKIFYHCNDGIIKDQNDNIRTEKLKRKEKFLYKCQGCGEKFLSDKIKMLPGCGKHECDGFGCVLISLNFAIKTLQI